MVSGDNAQKMMSFHHPSTRSLGNSSNHNGANTERGISRMDSMRSFRQAVDDDDSILFAADIAECVSSELTTIGLIAALLSSWGATVYGGDAPPEGGLCYGPDMVRISHVLFWISLGWFFLCVSSSLVIVADLHGVPQRLILEHLKNEWVRFIYQIPEISIIGGVIFLAAGYTVDIGERAGCFFLYCGMIAAPGFVGTVGVLFCVLRNDRRRLNSMLDTEIDDEPLGRSLIATWRDRLHVANKIERMPNNSIPGRFSFVGRGSFVRGRSTVSFCNDNANRYPSSNDDDHDENGEIPATQLVPPDCEQVEVGEHRSDLLQPGNFTSTDSTKSTKSWGGC
mmetsp:Transcript_23683/g.36544  ORF Transcript_23683/g.36544 Transcript_23683/m.36544 type:complete len:338 (+) Transcript_23683:47-1060(+)